MQKLFDSEEISAKILQSLMRMQSRIAVSLNTFKKKKFMKLIKDERGDVPGWVLVVLMTTGLVTAIWTIAAPRLSAILKNSLDAMNGIR
jgi:ribosomal protein L39E